jgi:hypothetical protein
VIATIQLETQKSFLDQIVAVVQRASAASQKLAQLVQQG